MRVRTPPPRRLVAYALYLTLVAALLLHFFHALLPAGYPNPQGDAFGHLYKIWKVWHSGYVTWASEWYTGYPFERFYPPLTYLLGGLYAALAHSAAAAYKLVTLTAMLLSIATTYWTTRKLGMGFHASAVASVVYTFAIWNVIIPIGGLPDYYDAGGLARYLATGLAPLLPLALRALHGGTKAKVAAGLAVGGLLLTHHTLCVTASYAALVIVVAVAILRDRKPTARVLKRLLTGVPIVVGVGVLVTAFWLIPLIADFGYANFRAENTNPELYHAQSLSLENAVMIRDEAWLTHHALTYHVLVTATPLLALATRKSRASLAAALIAGAYWGAIGLSMGAHGPLSPLNQLPLLALVRANRWSDALPLLAAVQAALLVTTLRHAYHRHPTRVTRTLAPVLWSLILLVPALTVIPYSAEYTTFHLPDALQATLQYLSQHTHATERVYQYGLLATAGSLIGYTPALTGVNVVAGWYRQGDPLEAYRMALSWALTEAPATAATLLAAYNVKHVLLDQRHPRHADAYYALTTIGFHDAFTRPPYIIMSTNTTAYLTLLGNALAIGDEWVIRNALETPTRPITYLGHAIPDDLHLDQLTAYDVLILSGYTYATEDWEAVITQYVDAGGIVVLDPYRSPDQTQTDLLGLGITTATRQVMGPLESRDTSTNQSWICTYTWNAGPWEGCTVDAPTMTEVLRIGSETGISLLPHGHGHILLVGLNLMAHGLYANDLRNIATLRTTITTLLANATTCTAQRTQDEHITLTTASTRPATIRVSETWFPYWDIYIDGHDDGRADQDAHSGVMVIQAPPGQHTISLLFHDPFRPLRYVSLVGGIIAVLYLVLPATTLQRSFKQVVKRIRERDGT